MAKFKDYTGFKTEHLTVIERAESRRKPNGQLITQWKCKCDCGNEVIVSVDALSRGRKSCGCRLSSFVDLTGKEFSNLIVMKHEKDIFKNGYRVAMWRCKCKRCGKETIKEHGIVQKMIKDFEEGKACFHCNCFPQNDLTGYTFGRLTVQEFHGFVNHRGMWKCLCECGNTVITETTRLKSGVTTSCGCYRDEVQKKVHTTHGKRHTRLFNVWSNMKQRCYNPNSHKYPRYGQRGIKVCDEWLSDFGAFYEWSMANGYADDLTIDRIDNDGNYEPSNCRWATHKEQANNTSKNRYETCFGYTLTISEWIKVMSIDKSVVYRNLKRGKSLEEVFIKKHSTAEIEKILELLGANNERMEEV